MKKTLTAAALSSVLVLGLAASGLAAGDTTTTGVVAKGASKVTIDGAVRTRGFIDQDHAEDVQEVRNTNSADDTTKTGYDTRVQLGVKAQVSDEATGYIKLETASGNSDTDGWGAAGESGSLHLGGDKDTQMDVLEAWINYQPGMWGVKAGHMPLALGNKMFFDHTNSGDDALVFYANPNEATHIAALTIKFDEQDGRDNSDDLDGYVALITHKLNDNVNLGANWTYLHGGSESFTGNVLTSANFAADGDLTSFDAGNGPIELAPDMAMHNVGLTADGKVGAIEYLADLELQFGDVANLDDDSNDVNIDANGWAMKLGGKYDLGAGKIGLLFGYGSGDDDEDVNDDIADMNAGSNDMDHDAFINFLGDSTYDTIIAGFRSAIPGANSYLQSQGISGSQNTGLSNLTLYQLNGSTKVVCPLTGKDLSLFSSVSYMQLSEDFRNGTDDDGDDNMVDEIGTELDMIATWALSPGLTYKVEAAYLWTGDAYETEVLGDSSETQDLYFLRHGLELKF